MPRLVTVDPRATRTSLAALPPLYQAQVSLVVEGTSIHPNCESMSASSGRNSCETPCRRRRSGKVWCPCAWEDASSGCFSGWNSLRTLDIYGVIPPCVGSCARPGSCSDRILFHTRRIWTVFPCCGCTCNGSIDFPPLNYPNIIYLLLYLIVSLLWKN